MGSFKFRFAVGNNQNISLDNGTVTFAFEFESTYDGDESQAYVMPAQTRALPMGSCISKRGAKGGKITWKAHRKSKFNERFTLEVDNNISLEFVNGDDYVYLHWEMGAVTRLKKDHIESFVLIKALDGKLGIVQCTVYENVIEYGVGQECFHKYIDETNPFNDDMDEIGDLLECMGFEVIR